MSDFIINFNSRQFDKNKIIASMKYFDDINVCVYDYKNFSLFLSRADDLDIWGPYKTNDGDLLIALAGRVAFESIDWEEARNVAGPGGLACKAIYNKYLSGGIEELEKLNGNFIALIIDSEKSIISIVTDRCGMFPCYKLIEDKRPVVIGSHPDIMAMAMNTSHDWDLVSIAEFLMTGKVSFPYSYYSKIEALDYGSVHEVSLNRNEEFRISSRKYFEFNFHIDHKISEWELAEELATAFRKAINRRTLPQFGQTGISLSGGLDSRTLLCSADDKSNIATFCFFDEENFEYDIAKQIAQKVGVKFIPLKRNYDHYGDNAEMGVRISGAMGDFASNHYLGFRKALKNNGIDNIIAGFYCDYLFKSLVLNKNKNKYLRTETFSKFEYQNYMPLFWFDTVYKDQVKARLDDQFPDDLKKDDSDLGRLEIERRRLFPLYLEPDNQETTIPQRVMGWYLPIVDNDIIDTYLKIPPNLKLNTSMYSKMVSLQCGVEISKITNSNTGTRVNAPHISVILQGYVKAIQTRIKQHQKSIATNESWPNWPFYINNSRKIESLWLRKNEAAFHVFGKILGKDPYGKSIREYKSVDLKLFLRLLTVKAWFDQRT